MLLRAWQQWLDVRRRPRRSSTWQFSSRPVESLEIRCLPAATSVSVVGNNVTVSDDGSGNVTVTDSSPNSPRTFAGVTTLTISGSSSANKIVLQLDNISGVTVNANGGDDTIDASTSTVPVTINGGSGNDLISGGSDNDSLNGGSAGRDTIMGFGGDDTINGLSDNDVLFGGDGNDSILGGTGNDMIDGGNDDDLCFGEDGDDSMTGGAGQDVVNGQGGNDSVTGGDGNDFVYGGAGQDAVSGGAGNDMVKGQGGVDRIEGSRLTAQTEIIAMKGQGMFPPGVSSVGSLDSRDTNEFGASFDENFVPSPEDLGDILLIFN